MSPQPVVQHFTDLPNPHRIYHLVLSEYLNCTNVNRLHTSICTCTPIVYCSFEIRCARSGTFNCDDRNPCAPRLCWDALKYPGISRDAYVLCGSVGECAELTCPSPHVFNEEQQECLPGAE